MRHILRSTAVTKVEHRTSKSTFLLNTHTKKKEKKNTCQENAFEIVSYNNFID